MSGHAKITAAILTLDESPNVAALLPLLDWVDEVVIVDSGSSDDTVEVARRHGCRVAERRFDTFAGQRNYAISLAKGDWVLSIDADERPVPRLAAEIRRTVARTRCEGFRLPIRSTIFGRRFRRSGTQDDRPVRLFRKQSARWVGDVHEVLQVRGRIGQLQNGLEHQTLPNLEVFLAKMHRYTSLEARARVAAGCGPRSRDRWMAPAREVFRRLIWKQGILDGPEGWAFCMLSGLSEWVLAREHCRLWKAAAEQWQADSVRRPSFGHGKRSVAATVEDRGITALSDFLETPC